MPALLRLAATALLTGLVLAVTSPAYAGPTVVPDEPPGDNSRWVAIISILVVGLIVGGMLFLVNAYRKNSDD